MTGELPGARQVVHVEDGYGYGVVGADLHVFTDRGPVYLLVEHRVQAETACGTLSGQPSQLLNARYQVVKFTGRRAEQDKLAAWRDAAAPRLSVRWLHGPGGQGKTRLADEFAARSSAVGWKVARAQPGPQEQLYPPPGSHDLRVRGERGLLLILDYADRWPVSHLKWLFSNALFHQGHHVRMLLLARSLQPWPVIRAALADVQAETRAQALAPLGGYPGEREEMFAAARDCFAARYGLADPAGICPPGPLEGPEFGLVLAVHMAALAAVDAHVHGSRPPEDLAGLSAYLLGRERLHWNWLYETRNEGKDYSTSESAMAHVVFTAALTGAMPYDRGVALLRGLDLASHPARTLTDHALCYPPADPGTVLEPLYPDRLAEDYLALTFPGHAVTEDLPAPWAAPTALALTTRGPGGTPPAHTARLLAVLAAAASRWPHMTAYLGTALRADPGLAVAAGSAALTAVADLAGLDPAVLQAVEAHFPEPGQADLDPGIAAVTARLAQHRLATTTDPARRVSIYMTLATRQGRAGHYEQALAAQDQALAIVQRLGRADPGSFEPLLAVVLADRGGTLGGLHRWAEATAAGQQAVEIYLRLAEADPARYEPALAGALSHLGVSLAHLERRQQALEAEEQAVEIRRRLALSDPARYEPDLASSLSNLGNRFSELGRWQEALEPTDHAVRIRKRLVRTDPSEEPGLARSLSGLGQRLRYLRRREEALEAEQQAVAIFERLASVNPAAYQPSLATSLSNLATHLTECQQLDQALARIEQALAIRQRLASASPEAYGPQLAESLSNYGTQLAEAGRHEEALAAVTNALSIFRRLAQTSPGLHEPRLALTLAAFAKVSLDGQHDLDAAIAATAEALDILLSQQNPAAFGAYFQATLALHADVLQALGRIPEAGALRRMLRTGDTSEVRRMMVTPRRTR